jgi:putative hydrolase of the HAD superfamily
MKARAVLLDALGTLVGLRRPWPLLVEQLGSRGVAVTEDEARAALTAEIAFYRAHHGIASDRAGLAQLRGRCALVLRDELPEHARGLDLDELEAALVASLRFDAFPEVPDTLRALRAGGARLVVASNWDVSLHDVLESTGLTTLLDGVVTSAELGVAKPDPRLFHRALDLAGGIAPGDALHAGDDLTADVEGAQAAGIVPVLVAREGEEAPPGVHVVTSLDGLVALAS